MDAGPLPFESVRSELESSMNKCRSLLIFFVISEILLALFSALFIVVEVCYAVYNCTCTRMAQRAES